MPSLFEDWSIGPIELKHRIVLAPLTRIRAELDSHDANDLIGEYYEQRASEGGLIITEVSTAHAFALRQLWRLSKS